MSFFLNNYKSCEKFKTSAVLTFGTASCGSYSNVTVATDWTVLTMWSVTTVNFKPCCGIDQSFVVTAWPHFHTCGITVHFQQSNREQ